MIVNYKANGWEIITQRTHGLLSLQLALHWLNTEPNPRWPELLIAIADHDDAQTELQREDLLSVQGGPLDFKMKAFTLEHAKCTMEFALSKSRYVALLCGRHLDFIAGDHKQLPEAVQKFLSEQKKRQGIWRSQLGIHEDNVMRDYRLLEWCDALSLLICQRENQPEERWVEISNGPDNQTYRMSQPGEGVLTVDPWPFNVEAFEIRFEKRELQQLKFRSSAAFKLMFLNVPVKEKVWLIKRTI